MSESRHQWQLLFEADQKMETVWREFMKLHSEDLVPFVREALSSREGRATAFRVARLAPIEQRQRLFEDMLRLACESSYVPTIIEAREFLMVLPRTWIVAQMRSASDWILKSNDEWIWRRFLELAALLDQDLTVELAHLATSQEDEAIREAGTEFAGNPNPR
jgi:hypothetical protein